MKFYCRVASLRPLGTGALLILFLAAACAPGGNGPGGTPETPRLQITLANPDNPDLCEAVITVDRPERDGSYFVQLRAEAGLRFPDLDPNQPPDIDVYAQEARVLRQRCEQDMSRVALPGCYVVRVALLDERDRNELDRATTLLCAGEQDGALRILPSQEAFNALYQEPFVPGEENLRYRLVLDGERATSGRLFVRFDSPSEGFEPAIGIEAKPGLRLQTDGGRFLGLIPEAARAQSIWLRPGLLEESGSRVITVPFALEAGAQEGRYALRVTVHEENLHFTETAPVAVQVVNAADNRAVAWLEAPPAGKPELADMPRHAPDSLPPLSLGAASAAGASPAPANPSASPPAPTPATTPAPAPTEPTPSAAPTTAAPPTETAVPSPTVQATWTPAPAPPAAPTEPPPARQALLAPAPPAFRPAPSRTPLPRVLWNRRVNNYVGNRRAAYREFVEGQVPMSFAVFNELTGYFNPHLVDDHYVYYPQKKYLFPAVAP